MTPEDKAAAIWGNVYIEVFARSKHPKLWEAMAALPDEEKSQIDDAAERVIAAALR